MLLIEMVLIMLNATAGLGPQAEGLFAGLVKLGMPSLFSMFLTPNNVGNAELTLGGMDSSKFTGV